MVKLTPLGLSFSTMGTVLKIGRGEPRILLISSSLVSENSPSLNPSVDPTLSGVPRSLPSLSPTIIPVYASTTGNDNKDCATWVS